ncbi:hypothetical protein A3C67_03195 [Candidatus Nomurabacteria bacterium RIFCSPHIGHO2_02_FULL_42_19]|uniref:Uncharacterized protein n=1 Tax=Candidatus Nomurabacteria bacterium RIFCSPHIGHO2_02_FULL_42_19 TaxID=1801756 RepID=A0A1F6W3B0_9BACT|nr:MAG: hypothetical protein A3C67_03195 [Candidatus Nomurabacteria bacterium RIFCSPHIGHO2_02_FULL_42_19]
MEGKNIGKEKGFFVPKLQLAKIRAEIARLEELRKSRNLKNPQEIKLKELKKIPRREMLKKSALVAGGIGIAVLGVKTFLGRKTESREKVSPLEGVLGVIKEYNAWFENLKGNFGEDEGLEKFVEIYNSWIQRINIDTKLSEIPKDAKAAQLLTAVQPLRDILEQQGYFFSALPTRGVWKNREIGFVAVTVGKIERKEKRTASNNEKKQDYEYILVGGSDPKDEKKQYESSPTGFTADTRREDGQIKLIQYKQGYAGSAENILRNLQDSPQSARDLARQTAFGGYRGPNAVAEIQRLIMQTSFEHEEQHVLDGVDEISEAKMNAENAPKAMILEMRGLIKPLYGGRPKVALYSIFNWTGLTDPYRRLVGETLTSILHDVSGKEFESLYTLTEDELRAIGKRAMEASDIFYKWVVVDKKPLDESLNQEYKNYLDKLKK